jgi:hypothetical protein
VTGENGPTFQNYPPLGWILKRDGPGEQAMTTDSNQTTEKRAGRTMLPVVDRILNLVRETPLRMPAGEWFSEIATNEDWRTTTIVQRHRDRAVMIPPS